MRFSIQAAIPIFLTATASLSRRQSLKVAAYAAATAFLRAVLLHFRGSTLAAGAQDPDGVVSTGRIDRVLLLFGVKLVLGQVAEEVSAIPANATLAQRAVSPLAIPTIAGAGSMLTVVLLTDNNVRTIAEQAITTSRLAISLVIVFCVLALSKWIFSIVGRPGIEVMKLASSGLILASIAVHNMIIAAKLSFGLA